MARCLVGGGTVKVPVGELAQVGDLVRDRLKRKTVGLNKGGSQASTQSCLPCSCNEAHCFRRSRRLEKKMSWRKGDGVKAKGSTHIQPGCCFPGLNVDKEQEVRVGI